MDTTIIGAIIGGLFAVIAVVVGDWLTKRHNKAETAAVGGSGSLPEAIVEELQQGPYTLVMANIEDIRWIAYKSNELYTKKDSVPVETKLSWYKKNKKGFWVIKNRAGGLVGSCELIPIKESTLELIRRGATKEKDKTAEDILSEEETKNCETLYLENFMAVDERNTPNQWAFKDCLIGLDKITSALGVNQDKTRIYAMPIRNFNTEYGQRISNSERLLRSLGFYKVSESTKQGYPLYCGQLGNIFRQLMPIKTHHEHKA